MSDPRLIRKQQMAAGRIAVLSHTHPSISKGGAEIAAYSLYTGLRQLGLDAVFIAACSRQDRRRLCLDPAHERAVFYDSAEYDHFYHLGTPEIWAQLRAILVADDVRTVSVHHFLHFGLNALRSLMAEPQWDTLVTLHEFLAICHHHGQMITRPARLLCDASSPAACAACYPERTRQQFEMRRDLFLDTLGKAAGFVSPSRFLADRFVDWGLPRQRIAVVENGLMGHAATPAAKPRQPDAPWVFGFFGQINPFKGVDTLLRAVEALAARPELAGRLRIRIHGNLIGQPPEFIARFNAMLETCPLLSYAGPYNNAAVGRLMQACDYVLVPSNWWENSPVVIQEAFAAGRPVICSGIGGMAEKVKDGICGLHFGVGDHADLARVIQAAADAELHARLRAGVPAALDSCAMARDYLAALWRLKNPAPRDRPGKAAVSPVESDQVTAE
ncbi:MAG: glycosyltransferase [Paracraurococcus sp.]